jgi:hypothetical protein
MVLRRSGTLRKNVALVQKSSKTSVEQSFFLRCVPGRVVMLTRFMTRPRNLLTLLQWPVCSPSPFVLTCFWMWRYVKSHRFWLLQITVVDFTIYCSYWCQIYIFTHYTCRSKEKDQLNYPFCTSLVRGNLIVLVTTFDSHCTTTKTLNKQRFFVFSVNCCCYTHLCFKSCFKKSPTTCRFSFIKNRPKKIHHRNLNRNRS